MILGKDRNADFMVERAMAYLEEIENDSRLTECCEQMAKINAFLLLVSYEGSAYDQSVIDAIQSIKDKADSILGSRSLN